MHIIAKPVFDALESPLTGVGDLHYKRCQVYYTRNHPYEYRESSEKNEELEKRLESPSLS